MIMGVTVKVREKYQVTIPEQVRKKIPLKVGERVEVIAGEYEIVIRPVVEVPRGQSLFWSPEWQTEIQSSINNLKEGKVKVFGSVKEGREHFGD
jgi:antitoxin MazE